MRNQTILLSLLASLTASGCKQLECADGTIERDGACEPANSVSDTAMCGPFTELQGDRCVPQFPPTVCGDGVDSEVDPETGVTTCTGGGLAPCGVPISCPKPTGSTKQTFCGQIYDFETNMPIGDPAGTAGVPCAPGATTGPCSLQLIAYDALVFAANPTTAMPLSVGGVDLDNCGRFRVKDVETSGTGPFIGLGLDDASGLGAGGTSVTVAIAAGKQPNSSLGNLEHWIVKQSTVGAWVASGGPAFSATAGIYAAVFRETKSGVGANEEGVAITKNGVVVPQGNAFYFTPGQTTRTTIAPSATVTGMNGTVLVNNAVASEGLVYNGQGGLGAGCRWDPHAGASLGGIVFIQLFKKLDVVGQTCND